MVQKRHFHPCFAGRALGARHLLLAISLSMLVACHSPRFNKYQHHPTSTLTAQDSILGTEYPLPDYFQAQQDLLVQHSQPASRVIVPDGEYMQGTFHSGAIELIFDEIDSEPQCIYGHLEGASPDERVCLVIFGIPDRKLNRLVAGQKIVVSWIETVAFMKPFNDDRGRDFVAFDVEAK